MLKPADRIRYKPTGQLKMYNRIHSSLMVLENDERLVLIFIVDRTIRWGNCWERISHAEFERGAIRRRKGNRIMISRGTGLRPEVVDAAIKSLENRRAIETISDQASRWFKVNEMWCDKEVIAMWELNEADFEYPEVNRLGE